ncbi:MAG: hypothetical protein U9M92_00175 [Patescibacteria group bacterium]|nr:hypothetical protein [Patescibacteria group bacterium]
MAKIIIDLGEADNTCGETTRPAPEVVTLVHRQLVQVVDRLGDLAHHIESVTFQYLVGERRSRTFDRNTFQVITAEAIA